MLAFGDANAAAPTWRLLVSEDEARTLASGTVPPRVLEACSSAVAYWDMTPAERIATHRATAAAGDVVGTDTPLVDGTQAAFDFAGKTTR